MIYNKHPKVVGMNHKVEMDYSVYLSKPVLIAAGVWNTTQTAGTPVSGYFLPSQLVSINDVLAVPFKFSCYYRGRCRVIVHLNGTPMHSGTLLVTCMPIGTPGISNSANPGNSINFHLPAPHAFLYANQSSAVEVEVPFYVNAPVARTGGYNNSGNQQTPTLGPDPASNNFARVHITVVNPLQTGSGSTVLAYTVHIIFDELEFYVPSSPAFVTKPPTFKGNAESGLATIASKTIDNAFSSANRVARVFTTDILDYGRSVIRAWTGLHSPNRPVIEGKKYVQSRNNPNTVDAPVAYDKIDPYSDYTRIVDDYYFKTDIDEGDMSYLLSKYMHIGTFKVLDTDAAGLCVFSRPITPFQEIIPGLRQNGESCLYASMIDKLALCASAWRGDMEIMIQSSMTSFQTCKLYVVLDYSKTKTALNTTPKMDDAPGLITHTLEFAAGGTIRTVELPYISEFAHLPCTPDWAMQALSHGMYYIYVVQPLVSAPSQPSTAYFNVYVRCKPNFQLFGYSSLAFADIPSPLPTFTGAAESFQASATIGEVTAPMPGPQLAKQVPFSQIRPIVNVRDLTRRMYLTKTEVHSQSSGTVLDWFQRTYNLEDLIYGNGNAIDVDRQQAIHVIRKMFMGFRGSLKLKIIVTGFSDATLSYIPPPTTYSNFGTENTIDQAPVFNESQPSYWYNFSAPVGVEMPNYRNNVTSVNGVGDLKTQGNVYILEGEIPFMSGLDFVGSGDVSVSDRTGEFICNALGRITIEGTPSSIDSTSTSALYISIMVGFGDDARLGFNVFSPPLELGEFRHLDPEYIALLLPYYSVMGSPFPVAKSQWAPNAYYTRS